MDDRLLDQLREARWFAGKTRSPRLAGVTPLSWLREPGAWPAVRSEIAEIRYPGTDDHEFYQLLISYQPDDDHAADDSTVITAIDDPAHGRLVGRDGTQDPAAQHALLAAVIEFPESGEQISAHRVDTRQLGPGLPSKIFGGEQSNTSILYAHQAILKLFRRIEPGRNLDVETHEVLTRAGPADVASLYGWLQGSWDGPDGATRYGADLAMITEQLPDARDGWEYALAQLRAGHDFAARAAELGRTLARIHRALETHFPTSEIDGDELAMIMSDRLQRAALEVPQLIGYADGLSATFDAVRGHRIPGQRVHGDFHLGQALYTGDGWKIIDFEGEPGKPLAERSRPDSIWRDIAGALRSFDYAAAHRPDEDGVRWSIGCREGFLSGYGVELTDPQTATLLRGYEADKAIYEVVYEARHRPDWVQIPLAAIAALAAG